MNILFVCTGNTCRSPMAEALLKKLCGNIDGLHIASAGIAGCDGAPASRGACEAVRSEGMSLEAFSSRRLTRAMAAEADLILAMTDSHRRAVSALLGGGAAAGVRLLLDFDGGGEVPDPYGGDFREYRECLKSMRGALEALARQLRDGGGKLPAERFESI